MSNKIRREWVELVREQTGAVWIEGIRLRRKNTNIDVWVNGIPMLDKEDFMLKRKVLIFKDYIAPRKITFPWWKRLFGARDYFEPTTVKVCWDEEKINGDAYDGKEG